MAKNIIIALLIIIALGCKKYSNDDTTLYRWKRDLYRARVQSDEPAVFYTRDPQIARNPNAIFLSSDHVVLTEFRKDKQQDSIYKASGRMQAYKYEKLEQVKD